MARIARDEYDVVDFTQAKRLFDCVHQWIIGGQVQASYVADGYGILAAVAKMAFGNGYGVRLDETALTQEELFLPEIGSIVLEVREAAAQSMLEEAAKQGLGDFVISIGAVTDEPVIAYGPMAVPVPDAVRTWKEPLEGVFHTKTESGSSDGALEDPVYQAKEWFVCRHKTAKPQVFIPVFPGTNCEYDSAQAFERAGARAEVIVFRNQHEADIRDRQGADRHVSRRLFGRR